MSHRSNEDVTSEHSLFIDPLSIKKVGKADEHIKGHTTLPIKYKNVESMVILDSGSGISIAPKWVWERWGKPALHKTQMNLQLADGSLNNPIGIVEDIIVESCGIEYEHTFAIVDFGVSTNSEVILGQTFIPQVTT